MAPILSVFRSGASSDRRQQQQEKQHKREEQGVAQEQEQEHTADHDSHHQQQHPAADTTSTSLPSSDGREPFPNLPRDSPESKRLSRYPTNGGRPGTGNSTAPSPKPIRRTSSRFSRNTTPAGARDKRQEGSSRGNGGDVEKDKEAAVEKKDGGGPAAEKRINTATTSTTTDSGTTRAVAIPIRATQPSPPAQSTGTPTGTSIDPLSQHIFMRTNTDHTIPQRLRNPPPRPDSPSGDALSPLYSDLFPKHNAASSTTPTGGDAAGSSFKKRGFLGRLSMPGMPGRGKKKDDASTDDNPDSDSEVATTDGASARVFSQAIAAPGAGGGFMPQHKEPPRYIRTKAYNKKSREFGQMFLAQELVGTRPPENDTIASSDSPNEPTTTTNGNVKSSASVASSSARGGSTVKGPRQTGGAIWATEFSKDGKYLAAGGRDQVVRVWAVISTAEERKAQEEEEQQLLSNGTGTAGERLSAPVFMEKPFREFRGHTGEILDLSWSKNNFLLSSSMDKTVRLWHISRTDCLCTFKHKDFVTKLAFHPRDDRFFLAGSLDTMLRLWSIPDKAIAYSAQLPDLVTAVAFSPDGKTAIAGLLNGLCLFYDTEGLKFQTQIHVRSSRGKNAKGSKITGISTMTVSSQFPSTSTSQRTGTLMSRTSSDLAGDAKILITSNDSRIRIYNMRDKSLEHKLKGHENACSQIAASFSDDGKYIICGSEDRKAFIWNVAQAAAELNPDKKPYECFAAHPDIVTTAIFAPTKTRILLNGGGDPIFELCNPPPVTLMSLEEAASATTSQVDVTPSIEATVTNVTTSVPATPRPRPEESPAYIARSTHYDGNIIVTTDDTGIIKVFRQDCAAAKRKHDNWETASSTFGRRQSQAIGGGFSIGGANIGRSASILTRSSMASASAAHSRRGSLSQLPPNSTVASPQLGGLTGAFNAGHSDRILSWRQGIERNASVQNRPVSSIMSTARNSERSLSPSKSGKLRVGSSASEARKQPYANSNQPPPATTNKNNIASPTSSTYGSIAGDRPSVRASKDLLRQNSASKKDNGPAELPTPSFSFVPAGAAGDDGLQLDAAGAGYSFWNLNRWRNMATRSSSGGGSGLKAVSDHSHSPRSRSGVRSPDKESVPSPLNNPVDTPTTYDTGTVRRKSLGTPGAVSPLSHVSGGGGRPQSAYFALNLTTRGTTPLPVPQPQSQPQPRSQSIPRLNLPDDHPHTPEHDELLESGSELSPYGEGLYSRGNSIASKLTSELNFEKEVMGSKEADESEDEMRCRRCGGQEFKAKRVAGRRVLSCGRCGEEVDE
ncbi:hypothetical protein GE09DRAFT_1220251 [Coniochaeta sp. 2T2.1]|nr:hypothetical protein GE09DRAFT_1220251 [Coniochaeta sp. 2T2.1]